MNSARTRSAWLLALSPFLLAGALSGASAQGGSLEGVIRNYECGDNCYLTIADAAGEEHTGLCTAPQCAEWNEVAAMPESFLGQRVVVTLGQGVQTDAEGNVMGEMTAFEEIVFAQ